MLKVRHIASKNFIPINEMLSLNNYGRDLWDICVM